MKPLIDESVLARLLSVTVSTVRKHTKSGAIPHRTVAMYDWNQVMRAMKKHTRVIEKKLELKRKLRREAKLQTDFPIKK